MGSVARSQWTEASGSVCQARGGAIQDCGEYTGDSSIDGVGLMATVKLSDEALLAFFKTHPALRDRMDSIIGAVGNVDGDLDEADAAEERLVEEMRHLGREALQGWADERVEATEQEIRRQPGMHRQGKKNSIGIRNSARS